MQSRCNLHTSASRPLAYVPRAEWRGRKGTKATFFQLFLSFVSHKHMHEQCTYVHETSSVSACGLPHCIYSLFIPRIVKSDFHPNARLSPFQLNRLISTLTFKLTRWLKTTHSFQAYRRIQVRPNICQIHCFQPPQPLKPEYRVGARDTCSQRVGRGIFRLRAWDAGCRVGLGSVRYIWRTAV